MFEIQGGGEMSAEDEIYFAWLAELNREFVRMAS